MRGSRRTWNPWVHLRDRHPDVQVVETTLPGQLLGCVDHTQRIIWIAEGLCEVRRTSTLAYEIGQLEQGPTPDDPKLAWTHQRAAEDWAARRMLPFDCLVDGFRAAKRIPDIARFLEVDTAMLRARLRGLSDEEQDAIMEALQRVEPV